MILFVEKESTYLKMISAVAHQIVEPTVLLFDSFGITRFEERIVRKTASVGIESKPVKSETEKGIIMVDNLCSVIRRHEMNQDKEEFYTIIRQNLKKV